jgi:hypothetical protein
MTIISSPAAAGLPEVFTRAEAIAAGLAPSRVDRLAGQRVCRGAYATDPTSVRSRAQAALAVAGPQAALCGSTALRLAGVDLPARLERDPRIWIQVPPGVRGPRHPQIRLVRPRLPAPVVLWRQLRVVALTHCWLQVAAEANLDELVEIGDAMTRRRQPVATRAALADAVAQAGSRRGICLARAALQLIVGGTDSTPETDVRLLLVRAGLPVPVVNLAIRDQSGRILYWLDMAYPWAKLAIEYDGAIHVADQARMQRDIARRRRLESMGWRIITVSAADLLNNPLEIVATVRAALSQRTRQATA